MDAEADAQATIIKDLKADLELRSWRRNSNGSLGAGRGLEGGGRPKASPPSSPALAHQETETEEGRGEQASWRGGGMDLSGEGVAGKLLLGHVPRGGLLGGVGRITGFTSGGERLRRLAATAERRAYEHAAARLLRRRMQRDLRAANSLQLPHSLKPKQVAS